MRIYLLLKYCALYLRTITELGLIWGQGSIETPQIAAATIRDLRRDEWRKLRTLRIRALWMSR